MIEAEVIADSVNIFDHRLTSLVLTGPRWILAEFNTHRMLSRNSASSRAVPSAKMFKRVMETPFIPIAYQKEHSGMQGTEYITDEQDLAYIEKQILFGRNCMVDVVNRLSSKGVTKQITNRYLEPFMEHTIIATASELNNFFNLRCPQYKMDWSHLQSDIVKSRKDYRKARLAAGSTQEYFDSVNRGLDTMSELDWLKLNFGQAEIHIMALAEAMWDALNESTPKLLQPGEWHIPFRDNIDEDRIIEVFDKLNPMAAIIMKKDDISKAKVEIATARCARVSYINYEGKDDYEADFRLYKKLKDSGTSSSFHASPFEHCAIAMSEQDLDNYLLIEDGKTFPGRCRNFTGFIQNRVLIEKQFNK